MRGLAVLGAAMLALAPSRASACGADGYFLERLVGVAPTGQFAVSSSAGSEHADAPSDVVRVHAPDGRIEAVWTRSRVCRWDAQGHMSTDERRLAGQSSLALVERLVTEELALTPPKPSSSWRVGPQRDTTRDGERCATASLVAPTGEPLDWVPARLCAPGEAPRLGVEVHEHPRSELVWVTVSSSYESFGEQRHREVTWLRRGAMEAMLVTARGEALLRRGRHVEAERLLEQALLRGPELADTRFLLARSLLAGGASADTARRLLTVPMSVAPVGSFEALDELLDSPAASRWHLDARPWNAPVVTDRDCPMADAETDAVTAPPARGGQDASASAEAPTPTPSRASRVVGGLVPFLGGVVLTGAAALVARRRRRRSSSAEAASASPYRQPGVGGAAEPVADARGPILAIRLVIVRDERSTGR